VDRRKEQCWAWRRKLRTRQEEMERVSLLISMRPWERMGRSREDKEVCWIWNLKGKEGRNAGELEGRRDRGTEGQRDRGTEGQRDRGTEGQRDRRRGGRGRTEEKVYLHQKQCPYKNIKYRKTHKTVRSRYWSQNFLMEKGEERRRKEGRRAVLLNIGKLSKPVKIVTSWPSLEKLKNQCMRLPTSSPCIVKLNGKGKLTNEAIFMKSAH
jgi:hypothetical protein